jgi:hypothetical protein
MLDLMHPLPGAARQPCHLDRTDAGVPRREDRPPPPRLSILAGLPRRDQLGSRGVRIG